MSFGWQQAEQIIAAKAVELMETENIRYDQALIIVQRRLAEEFLAKHSGPRKIDTLSPLN